MAFNWNGNAVSNLNWNGNPVNILTYNGTQVWSSSPEPFYVKNRDNSNSITVSFTKDSTSPTVSLEYSLDNDTWSSLSFNTPITVPASGKIYYRAPQGVTNLTLGYRRGQSHGIYSSGPCDVGGDITTLLQKDGGITDLTGYSDHTFSGLCYANSSHGSQNVVDASKLILTPTSNFPGSCYYDLFSFQSHLISGPQIPQISVAGQYTFSSMFYYCSSLSQIPENLLNIPTVDEYTYTYMCTNCTSLTSVELTSSQTPPYRTYRGVFKGCSSLNSVKVHFTSFGDAEGTREWLDGVSATGTLTCPTALGTDSTISRGVDACPTGWTVVNI